MAFEDLIKRKFFETLEIYKTSAFYQEQTPILCKIHDAFGGMGKEHHNCLGCNFADVQMLIYNFLSSAENHKDIQDAITLYILTLYLLVERMDIVLEIVQVPDVYREKHFKVFAQIRKWANFIKHPKAFILTHHPKYSFEGAQIDFETEFKVIINDQFVTEYYKGESDPVKQKNKNKELYNKLRNQRHVLVLFPDVAQLTKKLCYSINSFADLINNNQVYRDILHDEATISNYFENE